MTGSNAIAQAPIAVDEMAFAIALFVAAANGRVVPPSMQSIGFSLSNSAEVTSEPILLGANATVEEHDERASDEVPLACAVSVLWHHYDRDSRQQAICARLVAFYSLMVRSRGVLLESWTEESEIDPKSVILEPAVVEAVASASLGESGQFGDAEFRALVQSFAERDGTHHKEDKKKRLAPRTAAPLPITDVVQQLSIHLLAFQNCVAALPDLEGAPQFRVVDQLCGRIATLSGNTGLQTMLSRAILATRIDYPWLGAAQASYTGVLEGLDRIHPPPTPQEAMKCEMAVLGSLIELLRSFLGDSVTLQLLRSLWPLANLKAQASATITPKS